MSDPPGVPGDNVPPAVPGDMRNVLSERLRAFRRLDCSMGGAGDIGCSCWMVGLGRAVALTLAAGSGVHPVGAYAAERALRRLPLDSQRGKLWIPAQDGTFALADRTIASAVELLESLIGLPDPSDQVRAALDAEYGYVLDELSAATFTVVSVPLSAVTVSNRRHAEQVQRRPIMGFYRHHPGPRGIVTAAPGGRFRLIDGHHRAGAGVLAGLREAPMLVAFP